LLKVAALLGEGKTYWRTVQLIIARTELVRDLIDQLDESLADRIGRWQCWSRRRIINAVDAAVRDIDPNAAKERRVRADDDRHISITPQPDGMAQVRGTLAAAAGAAFNKRLSEMARSVCAKDSRTIAQRRADALVALLESRALSCNCGAPDCPARAAETEPASGRGLNGDQRDRQRGHCDGESEQPGYLVSCAGNSM